MNATLRTLLIFAGGVTVGVLGANALRSGSARKLAHRAIGVGMDAKERAAAFFETTKEHVEDLVAEVADSRQKKTKATK